MIQIFAILSATAPSGRTTVYGTYDEGQTRFQIYKDLLDEARKNAGATAEAPIDVVTDFFYCEPSIVSGDGHA